MSKGIYGRIKAKTESLKENSAFEYIRRPLFTLSGNRELIAQGSISVEKYGETEIMIKVNKMTVTATGTGLAMCFYNRNTVKLSGYIKAITFEE